MTGIVRKPWGREYCAFRNEHVAIWVLEIRAGERTSLHAHPHKNTAFIVLSGMVDLSFIRDSPRRMIGLDKLNVFRGRFHSTHALDDAILLEVEAPDAKSDIVRMEDSYGRAAEPLEQPTELLDETCFQPIAWWRNGGIEHFAGCTLEFVSDIACPYYDNETGIFVVLRGGLERGLLPPGDAVDGATFACMRHQFKPIHDSQFLLIRKSTIWYP